MVASVEKKKLDKNSDLFLESQEILTNFLCVILLNLA